MGKPGNPTSINPLTINDTIWFGCMLSVGAKKWDEGGGQISAWGAVHMAAVAGYRMILVSTNGGRNHSSPLLGTPFLVLKAVFSQEQHLLIKESWPLKAH